MDDNMMKKYGTVSGKKKQASHYFIGHSFIQVFIGSFDICHFEANVIIACITGALWSKWGERGILREARDKRRRNKQSACYQFIVLALLPTYAHNWLMAVMSKGQLGPSRLML